MKTDIIYQIKFEDRESVLKFNYAQDLETAFKVSIELEELGNSVLSIKQVELVIKF